MAEKTDSSKRRKDILFIIIALAIIIIVAELFLFLPKNKKNAQDESIKETEPVGGYEIKDIPTGKSVENPEYGLFFLVPAGWTVRDEGIYGVDIFSPEVEFEENGGFLKSAREKGGCIINVSISKSIKVNPEIETDAEYLAIIMKEIKNGTSFFDEDRAEQEIINISGKEGLKTTYLKDQKPGYIEIRIPVGNIIYGFNNGLIFSDRCIEEFGKILDTVVINQI